MNPAKRSDSAAVSNRKKPGRPSGYLKHKDDPNKLMMAAQLINRGYAPNARQAFVQLTDLDETAMRRLQRHWKTHGKELLKRDCIAHRERCDIEYRNLRSTHPSLWARVNGFVLSQAGKRHLKTFQRGEGLPAHPMALGLANLLEAMDGSGKTQVDTSARTGGKHSEIPPALDPRSNSQAVQKRFDQALDAWLTKGVDVTPDALRALAERVDELADSLEADLAQKDT